MNADQPLPSAVQDDHGPEATHAPSPAGAGEYNQTYHLRPECNKKREQLTYLQ